jgi:hypothetical protein
VISRYIRYRFFFHTPTLLVEQIMPILVSCPACGRKHQAPDNLAGRPVRCNCGATLTVPAAATTAPVPSIFDDVTGDDFSRVQGKPTAPPEQPSLHANPYQAPALPAYGHGAQSGSRGMPSSAITASWALGIAGGLSTLLLIFGLGLVMISGPPVVPALFIGLMVIHLLIAAANIAAVVMLNSRSGSARIVGFIAAGFNVLGAPVHWICAAVALIALLQQDTGKYLSPR